jgi:hypothetical protein
MLPGMRKVSVAALASVGLVCISPSALAQQPGYQQPPPGYQQPPPGYQQPPPDYQQPPPGYQQPPPGYQQPPPGYQQPPPGYQQPPPGYQQPPPPTDDYELDMPDVSVRLDPFNGIISGRLGLELEVAPLDWLSVELVPVFVVMRSPPSLSVNVDNLEQRARGLGPISGASLGVGFWFGGDRALDGYVLRAYLTNFGYRYETTDDNDNRIDTVTRVERRFGAMFGSQTVIGDYFTFAGGLGIEYELNRDKRCFDSSNPLVGERPVGTRAGCDDGEYLIATERYPSNGPVDAVDLHGPLYPFEIVARISFGVTFEL